MGLYTLDFMAIWIISHSFGTEWFGWIFEIRLAGNLWQDLETLHGSWISYFFLKQNETTCLTTALWKKHKTHKMLYKVKCCILFVHLFFVHVNFEFTLILPFITWYKNCFLFCFFVFFLHRLSPVLNVLVYKDSYNRHLFFFSICLCQT